MPPKMLFTKPLTALLNANHTPQIHTLLLVTPAGKLLSHSSPLPAYLLRAQATLASSIWSAYGPLATATDAPSTIASTLPNPRADGYEDEAGAKSRSTSNASPNGANSDLASVMVQLDFGTVIVRQLRCSLLFVVIGPTTTIPTAPAMGPGSTTASVSAAAALSGTSSVPGVAGGSAGANGAATHLIHGLENLNLSHSPTHARQGLSPSQYQNQSHSPPPPHAPPPNAPGVATDGAALLSIKRERDHDGLSIAAASDAGSIATSRGVGAASLRRMRRQAEELANWLDGELAGFVLATEGR